MQHNNVVHPVIKTFHEYMPFPFVDEVSATETYVGYAHLRVGENEPEWQIVLFVKAGTVTKALYPTGSNEFKFKWSDRLTYTYSR